MLSAIAVRRLAAGCRSPRREFKAPDPHGLPRFNAMIFPVSLTVVQVLRLPKCHKSTARSHVTYESPGQLIHVSRILWLPCHLVLLYTTLVIAFTASRKAFHTVSKCFHGVSDTIFHTVSKCFQANDGRFSEQFYKYYIQVFPRDLKPCPN